MGNVVKRANIYFFVCCCSLFLFYVVRFPILSYQSELWAEQGTNYLYFAMESGILDNLMATDSGYLVIYPRVIALLVYYIFPLKLFPYITNLIALINISFFISYFCSSDYRRIISSDVIRMAICFFLGLFILPHFENFSYVNWSYHGIFFCLLLILGDINSWSRRRYFFFIILTAMLSASKFHFLLFFPVYALFTAYHLYNKNYRKGCFFLPSLLMMLLQMHTVFTADYTTNHLPLPEIIGKMVNGIIWSVQFYAPGFPLLLSILILSAIICILIKKYRTYNDDVKFILLCMYIAFSFRAISQLGFFVPYPIDLWTKQLPFLNRADFVSYVLILVIEILIVCLLKRMCKKRSSVYRLALVILVALNFHVFKMKYIDFVDHTIVSGGKGIYANSGWDYYCPLLQNDAYCVPINPAVSENNLEGWWLAKNVEILSNIRNPKTNLIPISYQKADYLCAVYMHYTLNENVKVLALDDKSNVIDEVDLLNDKKNARKYFYFSQNIAPKYIKVVREDGSDIDMDSCNAIWIGGRK